jgi:hypothetical protein
LTVYRDIPYPAVDDIRAVGETEEPYHDHTRDGDTG